MNKIERLEAVLQNKTPDHVPAGFWFHYPSDWSVQQTADAHIKLFRETGADIIKVMDDNFGNFVTKGMHIEKASDWRTIKLPGKNCEQYAKMVAIVTEIVRRVGSEVMVFPTMWSPFKIASFTYGACGSSDAQFMEHCRQDPESILCGIETLKKTMLEWTAGYLEAGASGIYYSGQFSEPQRFTDSEWRTLVMPSDLAILDLVKSKGKYNIVHICGEVEFDFRSTPSRYRDYPGDLYNWATHHNDLNLQQGKEMFGKPILGGMDNHGALVNGTPDEIRAEVQKVVGAFGKQGFMLGADCTVPADVDINHLRIAVETAASL